MLQHYLQQEIERDVRTPRARVSLLSQALSAHEAGRLHEAERLYGKVLARAPDNANAHFLRGLIAIKMGHYRLGAERILQALAIDANVAAYHANLGHALAALGQADEAINCFKRALALAPDDTLIQHELARAVAEQNALPDNDVAGLLAEAVQHHQAGRWDRAESLYQKILSKDPTDANSLHLLGVLENQTGRPKQSIRLIGRAIECNPTDAAYYYNLGTVFGKLGRLSDAVTCYRKAIELRPNFIEALHNLADGLARQGQYAEAVTFLKSALDVRPDFAEAANHLGVALMQLQRPEEAVASYQKALQIRPDYHDAYNNLGIALMALQRPDEAVNAYYGALKLGIERAQVHSNLALAFYAQGWLDESLACHRRALGLQPDDAQCHFNYSLALLKSGDMPAGWEEYEWRWRLPDAFPSRGFRQPQWRGEAASGATLLLHGDDRVEDILQFCRYAPFAAARGMQVCLEVPPNLTGLFAGLAGVSQVVGRGKGLPAFDLHCPMQSLPHAFATTLATIPAAIPYLVADPALAAAWSGRLPARDGRRIGLAWADDTLSPAMLAPLLDVPRTSCFSLHDTADLADAAGLVANLDLVIAVDGPYAHLAAALGKPVWLLNRFNGCWRWLHERHDSPWYPNLRIYRQPKVGAWAPVIDEVATELRAQVTPMVGMVQPA